MQNSEQIPHKQCLQDYAIYRSINSLHLSINICINVLVNQYVKLRVAQAGISSGAHRKWTITLRRHDSSKQLYWKFDLFCLPVIENQIFLLITDTVITKRLSEIACFFFIFHGGEGSFSIEREKRKKQKQKNHTTKRCLNTFIKNICEGRLFS